MNKKFIYLSLSVVCLFHFHSVNAKSINGRKDSGLYISLNGGSSIPLGYFKSQTFTGVGGYALNGYGGNISIEHPLKLGWLGLTFEGGYYENPFNLSPFENVMYSYLANYQFMHYTFLGATPYKQTNILGGVFFEKKIKKLTLELKCMAGVDILTTPDVNTIEVIGASDFPWIILPGDCLFINTSQTNAVWGYDFEVSIRYALSRHLSVRANASYINSFLNTTELSPVSYGYIPISQLHLETGLTYHF